MSFFLELMRETWLVIAEAAPWLLVGFLIAGLLKVFIPGHLIARSLGRDNSRSVLLAALWGAPIPLCSCSVIPTASALRKSGASKGATASFLISTPETGVDSISVTYALLDPLMTVLRPLAALMSAAVAGNLVNLLVRKGWDGAQTPQPELEQEAGCGCATTEERKGADGQAEEHNHGGTSTDDERSPVKRMRIGLRYAFVDLLDDLTPVLFIGLLLSGLISVLVPAEFFREVGLGGWGAMLLMIVVGTPLYVCATASTPIAAALIAKGLNPGAALVFLLVGPATNITTLLVVGRMLGRQALMAYLVGVIGVALSFGFASDVLYSRMGIDLGSTISATLHGGPGLVAVIAGVALLLLLGISAVRIHLHRILWGWMKAPLKWMSGGSGPSTSLCFILWAGLALLAAGTGSCRTTETETPVNSGVRAVPRAQATKAWTVALDGETFGRVVRFDVEERPSESRFVVQNPFGQDLGMIDSLGRAYRFEPHKKPHWVGTGSVEQGVASILDLTGNLQLQEVAMRDLKQGENAAKTLEAGTPKGD